MTDYTNRCLQCDEPFLPGQRLAADKQSHAQPIDCRDAQARHIMVLKERVAELEREISTLTGC